MAKIMRLIKPNPIPERCSFCQQKLEATASVKKPGIAICVECVRTFMQLLKSPDEGESTEPFQDCHLCGFLRSSMPPCHEIALDAGISLESEHYKDLERKYNELLVGQKSSYRKSVGTRLFRGDDCAICDECLRLCADLLETLRLV
jgi:ATP-dependent protease Clp ATPase subunit